VTLLAEPVPRLERAGPHICSGRDSGRCEALRPLCGAVGASPDDQLDDPKDALDDPHTRASFHASTSFPAVSLESRDFPGQDDPD
jgi:hypothetical protein